MNPRRLYRSADDRWIAGVAAGVADYFDVDPILVRVIWIISIPLTGFFSLLAYIIMAVVVPLGPGEWTQPSPWQPGGAPVGYGAPAGYGAAFTPPTGTSPASTDPNATTAGTAPAGDPTDPAGNPAPGVPFGAPAPGGPVPGPTPGWDWRWQSRQDRWQRRAERWEARKERRGSGGIVFGALLIVVGGLVAWHEIDPRLDLNLAWPIAIIAFGVFLVLSSVGYHRAK